MRFDRFSESKPVEALTAAQGDITTATTTTGQAIDTLGYNSFTVGLNVSDVTAGQIDSITFQESSDSGSSDAWEAIPNESLFYPDGFPITATGIVHVGCIAKERYIRLAIVTSTGTTVDITVDAAVGLLQDGQTQPGQAASSVLADADVNSPGQTADAVTTFPKRT